MRGNPLAAGRARAFQRGSRSNNGKARVRGRPACRRWAGSRAASRCRCRCRCAGSWMSAPACAGRAGGKATTIPRAATMISRRAAASAGRSRLSTARWRWRGRVLRGPSTRGGRRSEARPWRRAWPARASAPRNSSRLPHSSPSTPSSIQTAKLSHRREGRGKALTDFLGRGRGAEGVVRRAEERFQCTWLDGAARKSRKNRKQREWYPRFRGRCLPSARRPG